MKPKRKSPQPRPGRRKTRRPGICIKPLSLDEIRLDGNTQTRAELNRETVEEYAEVMAEKGARAFQRVVVYQDREHINWLADGFHRVAAARKNRHTEIMAEVRLGTRVDALIYSLGANHAHGLRRTNADKRRSVELALAEETLREYSDRRVAELCGVGHHLVSQIRAERGGNDIIQVGETPTSTPPLRKGRDGKLHPSGRAKRRMEVIKQTPASSTPENDDDANPPSDAGHALSPTESARDVDSHLHSNGPPAGHADHLEEQTHGGERDYSEQEGIPATPAIRRVPPPLKNVVEDGDEADAEISPQGEKEKGYLLADGARLAASPFDDGLLLFTQIQAQLEAIEGSNHKRSDRFKLSAAQLAFEQVSLVELVRTANRLLRAQENTEVPPARPIMDSLGTLRNLLIGLVPHESLVSRSQ